VETKKNGSARVPVDRDVGLAAEHERELSQRRRVPAIDLVATVIEPTVTALVSKQLCERHTSIPVSRAGNHLIVAMADPGNPTTFDELAAHTGLHIEPVIAPEASILEAIRKYYGA
jgi:type IV pilus assembly protein PilB